MATANHDVACWWLVDRVKEADSSVLSVVVTEDGDNVMVAGSDKCISMYKAKKPSDPTKDEPTPPIRQLRGHKWWVTSLCCSSVRRCLFSGSGDASIRCWSLPDGNKVGKPLLGHVDSISSMALSENGAMLYTGSTDGQIKLWDLKTRTCTSEVSAHEGSVTAMCISRGRDGKLFSSSADSRTKCWRPALSKCIRTYKEHSDGISCSVLSPDDKWVFTGAGDGLIKRWDVDFEKTSKGEELDDFSQTMKGHKYPIAALCISPDGSTLYSGDEGGYVRVWKVPLTLKCYRVLMPCLPVPKVVAPPSDAAGGEGGEVSDSQQQRQQQQQQQQQQQKEQRTTTVDAENEDAKHTDDVAAKNSATTLVRAGPVTTLTVTSDGKVVYAGFRDGGVICWDRPWRKPPKVESAKKRKKKRKKGSVKGQDSLIDTSTLDDSSVLSNTSDLGSTTSSSDDDDADEHDDEDEDSRVVDTATVYTAGGKGEVMVWRVPTGTLASTFSSSGVRSDVTALDSHVESGLLICGHADGVVKKWELPGGRKERTLEGHRGLISSTFSFSFFRGEARERERWLITTSGDGSLRYWSQKDGLELASLRGSMGAINTSTVVHQCPEKLRKDDPFPQVLVLCGSDTNSIWIWRCLDLKSLHEQKKKKLAARSSVINAMESATAPKKPDREKEGLEQARKKVELENRCLVGVIESLPASPVSLVALRVGMDEMGVLHLRTDAGSTSTSTSTSTSEATSTQEAQQQSSQAESEAVVISTTRLIVGMSDGKVSIIQCFIGSDEEGHRQGMSGSHKGTPKLFWKMLCCCSVHIDWVRTVAPVMRNGGREVVLICGGDDTEVKVTELTGDSLGELATVAEVRQHKGSVRCVALSRGGQYTCSGSSDRTIVVWDTESLLMLAREEKSRVEESKHRANGEGGDGEGGGSRVEEKSGIDGIISSLTDTPAAPWFHDARVVVMRGHTGAVEAIEITEDNMLISGSQDHTIRMWTIPQGSMVRVLSNSVTGVSTLSLSTDGEYLISGGFDTTVSMWKLPSGAKGGTVMFEGNERRIVSTKISQDGSRGFALDEEGVMRCDFMSQTDADGIPGDTAICCIESAYNSEYEFESWLFVGTMQGRVISYRMGLKTSSVESELSLPVKSPVMALTSFQERIVGVEREIVIVGCESGAVYFLSGDTKRVLTNTSITLRPAPSAIVSLVLHPNTDGQDELWSCDEGGRVYRWSVDDFVHAMYQLDFGCDSPPRLEPACSWAMTTDDVEEYEKGVFIVEPYRRKTGRRKKAQWLAVAVVPGSDGFVVSSTRSNQQPAMSLWRLSTESEHQMMSYFGEKHTLVGHSTPVRAMKIVQDSEGGSGESQWTVSKLDTYPLSLQQLGGGGRGGGGGGGGGGRGGGGRNDGAVSGNGFGGRDGDGRKGIAKGGDGSDGDGGGAVSGCPISRRFTGKAEDIGEGGHVAMYSGHAGWVTWVGVSSDGMYIYSASSDCTVKGWKQTTTTDSRAAAAAGERVEDNSTVTPPPPPQQQQQQQQQHEEDMHGDSIEGWECSRTLTGFSDWVTAALLDPNGTDFYACSADGSISRWVLSSAKCLVRVVGHKWQVTDMSMCSATKQLFTASADARVRVWSLPDIECLYTLPQVSPGAGACWIRCLEFSSVLDQIVCGCDDGVVRVWDPPKEEEPAELKEDNMAGLAFASSRTAFLSKTKVVKQKKPGVPLLKKELKCHKGNVRALCVSQCDSRTLIISGGSDATIHIVDTFSYEAWESLQGHDGPIEALHFYSGIREDGDDDASVPLLFSGSADRTVRVWRFDHAVQRSFKCVAILRGHLSWVSCVNYISEYGVVVTSSGDSLVGLWSLPFLRNHDSNNQGASGGTDKSREALPLMLGTKVAEIGRHKRNEGTVSMIRSETLGVTTLSGHSSTVSKVVSIVEGSPQQHQHHQEKQQHQHHQEKQQQPHRGLLSSSYDGTLRVWGEGSGEDKVATVSIVESEAPGLVTSVLVGAGSRWVVTGADSGCIKRWVAVTDEFPPTQWECTHESRLHTLDITQLVTSKDESVLFSSSGDRTMRVWHTSYLVCVAMLVGHSDWVRDIGITFSDSVLLSVSDDHTLKLWSIGKKSSSGRNMARFVRYLSAQHALGLEIDTSECNKDEVQSQAIGISKVEPLSDCVQSCNITTASVKSLACVHYDDTRVPPELRASVVMGCGDMSVTCWSISGAEGALGGHLDALLPKARWKQKGHTGAVTCVCIVYPGRFRHTALAVSGSVDCTIRMWTLDEGLPVLIVNEHVGHVTALTSRASGEDGEEAQVISGSADTTIRVWNLGKKERRGIEDVLLAPADKLE